MLENAFIILLVLSMGVLAVGPATLEVYAKIKNWKVDKDDRNDLGPNA